MIRDFSAAPKRQNKKSSVLMSVFFALGAALLIATRTYDMKHHGCSRTDDISLYYGNFEKPLVEMGVQHFGRFGDAQVRIVDAMACRELIMKIYSRATEDIFPQHIEIPESWYKD